MTAAVETMAYAGAVPWHGLGTRVDPRITPDEMCVAAGLDWTINPFPVYAKIGDEFRRVHDKRAFYRSSDDRMMTMAGMDWTPVQNRDMLGFFRDYAAAGGVTMETAGSLRDGTIVWALANLPAEYTVGKHDLHKGYLLMTGSHKVGMATTQRATDIRVVCQNTMFAAHREGTMLYRQSHLAEFDVAAAKLAVEQASDQLMDCGKRMNKLAKVKMTPDETFTLLHPIFAPMVKCTTLDEFNASTKGNALKQVFHSITHAPGATPGTAYGVLNGVTHWADHVNGQTSASRMFRSWCDDIAKTKLVVERKLMELA